MSGLQLMLIINQSLVAEHLTWRPPRTLDPSTPPRTSEGLRLASDASIVSLPAPDRSRPRCDGLWRVGALRFNVWFEPPYRNPLNTWSFLIRRPPPPPRPQGSKPLGLNDAPTHSAVTQLRFYNMLKTEKVRTARPRAFCSPP